MTRLLNVATSLTTVADTDVAPSAKVPPMRVSLTVEESVVTVWPVPSSTATTKGGLRGTPAVPLGGCWR